MKHPFQTSDFQLAALGFRESTVTPKIPKKNTSPTSKDPCIWYIYLHLTKKKGQPSV